ncbi:MAG: hypothetical protein OXF79_23900 [Chloroflexi bacterium]|nr:hypothetical protein [Chloroflexota bacterium]
MKQLASIATCLVLFVAAPGLASDSEPLSEINSATAGTPTLPALTDIAPDGVEPIGDREFRRLVGAGWQSDFACGIVSGFGLALAATGGLAPVGLAVAGAGVACSVIF